MLDAYQGPYKDKYYFWTGLELVMRAVFFGLSALNRNTNLMISSILIGMAACIHGTAFPFKRARQINPKAFDDAESNCLHFLLIHYIE